MGYSQLTLSRSGWRNNLSCDAKNLDAVQLFVVLLGCWLVRIVRPMGRSMGRRSQLVQEVPLWVIVNFICNLHNDCQMKFQTWKNY